MPRRSQLLCALIVLGTIGAASSQTNHNIHTTWLWHLHQPIYWPDKRSYDDHYENAWDTIQAQNGGRNEPNENLTTIFSDDNRVSDYQQRAHDVLSNIGSYLNSGVQLNMSGALMENVQSLGAANQFGYSGTWYQWNQEAHGWTTTGGKPRMDLTNFTYHHAMAPLISDATLLMELQIHQRQMQIFWGPNLSRGYFPSETCFSERMIPILNQLGIVWTVVANNHLARACPDMPLTLGSGGENCDIPNKADQLNPAQGSSNYQTLSIDRGCSPTAAMPFCFQVHTARYVDPATGAASTITVVPADQAFGWKDSYSTWDLGLLDPLAARNNASKPALLLLAHDGDNAWSDGYSYYFEWAGRDFPSQASSRGYELTTVEQFLNDWPADPNDIVHVEDGGWVYADSDFGSPSYINWNWPPSYNDANGKIVVDPSVGTTIKGDFWRTTIATENRVRTAQQIAGLTPRIDQIRDPGSFSTTPNNVELAWHYYLAGLDSGFLYFGVADQIQRCGVAQSNVVREIDSIVNNNLSQDTTAPTVFLPQRHPWNPGGQNFGVQYGYQSYTPPNTDFWIWTYAYDASGIGSVTLKYRSNGNAGVPNRDEFKMYAGGADTSAWQSISMTRRVVPNQVSNPAPQYYADYYYAKITGLSDTYVDYYVTAADTRGNMVNSAIQHVYVSPGVGSTPTPTPTVTPTPTPTATPTPTPGATPIPFTMDGVADSAGYLQNANGMTIYAAVRGTKLYVATWSPGNSGGPNDHFIFVSNQLLGSATTPAPWAKAGTIAIAANMPYLAGESKSSYAGWFNAPADSQLGKAPTNSGQLEGVIDLVETFGVMPQTIYVAAVAYQTDDGGALAGQGPMGNGDENVDPDEFMTLWTQSITDQFATGTYDWLNPTVAFRAEISRDPNTVNVSISWPSIPGKSYQVEFSNTPTGSWQMLTSQMTAGPGILTLSATDAAPGTGPKFYQVRCLNPNPQEFRQSRNPH